MRTFHDAIVKPEKVYMATARFSAFELFLHIGAFVRRVCGQEMYLVLNQTLASLCRADMLEIAVDSKRDCAMSMRSLGTSKQLHAACEIAGLQEQKIRNAGSQHRHTILPLAPMQNLARWLASVGGTKRETCGMRIHDELA